MNIESNWSVNHHFCAVINPYPITQIWKYLHVFQSAITRAPPPKSSKPQAPPGKSPPIPGTRNTKGPGPQNPRTQAPPSRAPPPPPIRVQHTAEEQHQLPNPAHAAPQRTLNTDNNNKEQEELMTNKW